MTVAKAKEKYDIDTEEELKKIDGRMDELSGKYKMQENKDVATGHPEIGDWYVHQIILKNGKSRFFFAKLPKAKVFEMSRRWVLTEFGEMRKALAVPIVSRFLGIIEDYHGREDAGAFLLLSCPAYVKSNVSVQKMSEEVTREDYVQARETHEFNAAIRMRAIVDRERARSKNLERDVAFWQRLVSKDRGAYARSAHETLMEGDKATYDDMTKTDGFDFGQIIQYIKDNPLKVFIIIFMIAVSLWYVFG